MKKNLLIVGVSEHGRYCLDIVRKSGLYSEINFLDDATVENRINGSDIIDVLEFLEN